MQGPGESPVPGPGLEGWFSHVPLSKLKKRIEKPTYANWVGIGPVLRIGQAPGIISRCSCWCYGSEFSGIRRRVLGEPVWGCRCG
jgi:hypothetical protein